MQHPVRGVLDTEAHKTSPKPTTVQRSNLKLIGLEVQFFPRLRCLVGAEDREGRLVGSLAGTVEIGLPPDGDDEILQMIGVDRLFEFVVQICVLLKRNLFVDAQDEHVERAVAPGLVAPPVVDNVRRFGPRYGPSRIRHLPLGATPVKDPGILGQLHPVLTTYLPEC